MLVDGVSGRDPGRVVGKTPEFKNVVFPGEVSWIGSLRRVRVTESRGMTLTGEPVHESTAAEVVA